MTCPRCSAELEGGAGVCPECGTRVLRNVAGMLKTSAVMISAAGEQGFYRSVQDVPEPLRQELLRVTASENSGTIVIADRAGKEQMTQIVERRESGRKEPAADPQEAHSGGTPAPVSIKAASAPLRISWVIWAGAGLLLGSAAIIAAVFTIH
jgi:hypothetical protein